MFLALGCVFAQSGCYPPIDELKQRAADAGQADGADLDATAGDASPDTGAGGIKLLAATTGPPVDGTDVTVGIPLGIAAGDLLLITLLVGNGESSDASLSDEQGWLAEGPFFPQSCGGTKVWYASRLVVQGDPTQYVFGFMSNGAEAVQQTSWALVGYRGVDPAQPFAAKQAGGMAPSEFVVPSLVVPIENTTLVAMFTDGFNRAGTWDPPPGMNEVLDSGVFGVFDRFLAQSGQTPPASAASSSSGGCGTVWAAALAPK